MEWVETTGKTVEEARDLALDQLGVAEADAEIEVVEEPRAGLFGRTRGHARVKARIRPSAPRPKQERRRRTGRGSEGRAAEKGEDSGGAGSGTGSSGGRSAAGASKGGGRRDGRPAAPAAANDGAADERESTTTGRTSRPERAEERAMMPEAEQRESGETFLTGLLDGFGLSGTVSSSLDDEGILSFDVDGDELGLLIGPGLGTLEAIQEVCRNAIQRQAAGREYGKVTLDVAGSRAQRNVALEEFVRGEATRVLDDGDDVIFDVMSRSDRKVVHDVIGEFDGLATESVGEDPRRRVILRRA